MSKRFLLFEDDEVLVDFDEIVRVQALSARQMEARSDGAKTVLSLRPTVSGQVFLTIPFAEVAATIQQAVEVQ